MQRTIKVSLACLVVLCTFYLANSSSLASTVQERELIFEWEDDFITPALVETRSFSALPEKYDSRDANVITSVKNQGMYEVCWAMAAAQMAESSLLSKGELVNGSPVSVDSLDLSERHLAYFMHNFVTDPLGNTAGDRTEAIGRNYLWLGGHPIFTTFGLANWVGMAEEDTAPWQPLLEQGEGGMELSEDLAYQNVAHMQNAYWINTVNMSHIKEAIRKYGSVVMPMYFAYTYYNEQNASYYNELRTSDNHTVSIVGWDDSYPAANFAKDPGADGAFLVKNTYGNDWGDGGYFWISYQDKAIIKDTGTVYVFDFESADNYDNNYQYDGTAGRYNSDSSAYSNKIPSGGKLANVFQVSEQAGTFIQTLQAVSFSTLNANLTYRIQIYKNPTDAGNPESGEALLPQEKEGQTLYTGYYTVPLDSEIVLQRGDTFAVVITLLSTVGDITYCADYSYQNGNWIRFHSATSPAQSFVMNDSWQDLHPFGAAARVKAFTSNVYQNYTITVSIGNGFGGRVLGGGQVREGDSVTLTAIADEGYVFVNWTNHGEVIGTQPELVIESVTADMEICANFALLEKEAPEEEEKPKEPAKPKENPEPEIPEEPLTEPVIEPKQVEVVKAQGSIVQTGDTSSMEAYILLMAASGLVMVQILKAGWRKYG